MYVKYFVIIKPWKRAGLFIWTNLNPLHPRMLCVKFGWNWPSGSGEEDFLILSTYFRYFVIISPWKRAGHFIWTNLNPLPPRMLCAKFGWKWSSGSGEEDENRKSVQTDRQTDIQTDDCRKVHRKAHFSCQIRWAKNRNTIDNKIKDWFINWLMVYVVLAIFHSHDRRKIEEFMHNQ